MKVRPGHWFGVGVSVAASTVIVLVAFAVLREMSAEIARGATLGAIADKTRALHILTATGPTAAQSELQAQASLRSVRQLLDKVTPRTVRESVLIEQLRASYNELGPLIDRRFTLVAASSDIVQAREEMLASQIAIKVQFIADDTQRLMAISEARVAAGQQRAAITIIALFVLLTATNGVIYVSSLRKITRAQRALLEKQNVVEASEQRFRSLVGVITDVPWVTDPAGRFVDSQPAWASYTGQSFEQSQGFGWLEALHPDDRDHVRSGWADACATKTSYESQGRLWHAPTRRYRHCAARAVPICDANGAVREWVGTYTDVHEQRQAEEALRDADRRKNEFLAMLAHELRNPLAPIRTAAQLFRLKGPAVPELRWACEVVERQMQQMTRLIDDLTDVSRISRGKIELKRERVALADVVQRAVETTRPLIEQFGHELKVRLPTREVYLHADLARLAQVLANLLNNAAKYTDQGGTISVTAEQSDGDVRVSVKDSGIGIAPDKLHSVFELFSQAHAGQERSQGGLGIGLSLAKKLVEMHGGTIEARSEGLGRGSEFAIRLPILAEELCEPTRGDATEEEDVEHSPRRILVVDDNRDAADSLAMMLRTEGHETRTVYDGETAVVTVAEFRPHVVLLDLGLPRASGHDVCRSIRQQSRGRTLTVIAVTGWGHEEDRRKAQAAGFDDHLIKPVDPRDLNRLLNLLPATAP